MVATNTSNITIAGKPPRNVTGDVIITGTEKKVGNIVEEDKLDRKPEKLLYKKVNGYAPFTVLGYFTDTDEYETVDRFRSLIDLKKKYPTLSLK
jgi:hypothetical protein